MADLDSGAYCSTGLNLRTGVLDIRKEFPDRSVLVSRFSFVVRVVNGRWRGDLSVIANFSWRLRLTIFSFVWVMVSIRWVLLSIRSELSCAL
jgi:hypothetical protein